MIYCIQLNSYHNTSILYHRPFGQSRGNSSRPRSRNDQRPGSRPDSRQGQHPQQGRQRPSNQPLELKCICSFGDCREYSNNSGAFKKHVTDNHLELPPNAEYKQLSEALNDFSTQYFCQDTQAVYRRFAHVCKLCRKHLSQYEPVPTESSTKLEEDIAHISDHYSVPEYFCKKCSVWLNSRNAATKHEQQTPHEMGQVLFGEAVMRRYATCNRYYKQLIAPLISDRNLSTASANSRQRVAAQEDRKTTEPVDRAFALVLTRNDRDWQSLEDFRGEYSKVFITCGDMRFVSQCILSSPAAEVRKCCDSILKEGNLLPLLTHQRASCSLVSLLGRSDDTFFCQFVNIVKSNRPEVISSLYAAHAIRRLLTNCPISDENNLSLSAALLVGNCVDYLLAQSPFVGYFFIGLASRLGSSSSALAKYIAPNVRLFFKLLSNL